MKHVLPFVLVVAGLLAGCASFPKDDITIETDADPTADFATYKTYAWLGEFIVLRDTYGHWQPPEFNAEAEIVYQIDTALRNRGMSQVNIQPDVLVAYAVGVDMDAVKARQNPETKLGNLENVPQVGLVVVLIDPQTEYLTWAGTANGELKNLDPDTAKKRLEYVVSTMFEDLPK